MPFSWQDVFDRMGGLWTAVAAIVGFWVANYFELRRDARQAERDSEQEWRTSQQTAIVGLQYAVQKLSVATSTVTIMLPQVVSGLYPMGKDAILGEAWYVAWESAVTDVSVLVTHVESAELTEKVQEITQHGKTMIASTQEPIDFSNPRAEVDKFLTLNGRMQALTLEAQTMAGKLYQDLGRSSVSPNERSWLCKRVC